MVFASAATNATCNARIQPSWANLRKYNIKF